MAGRAAHLTEAAAPSTSVRFQGRGGALGTGETPLGAPATLVTNRHNLLRSQEVAEIFDVTERTVINWAAAGKLPCLRTIGGHLRFRREDVMRLLTPLAGPSSAG
jgi:excisionase family DNA binding protein